MNTLALCGLLVVLSGLAGCTLGRVPTPTPLRGEPPHVIAVWPVVAEPFLTRRDELLLGLAPAVQRRGYRTITAAVAAQMLGDVLPAPPDLAAVGMRLGADALLQLHIRRFETDADQWLRSAIWDLDWSLVSTRGIGTLWTFTHHGHFAAHDADRGDPLRPLDAEPDLAPAADRSQPGFRDVAELMRWLHHEAMLHLPELPR